LVNMVNSSSRALAYWCPQVSTTTISLPAILVPRSKPHIRQHGMSLLDLLHVYRSSSFFTATHQHNQETCYTRTHAMDSLQTQPNPIVSNNYSSQTRHTRVHINLMFAISLLISALSTPTHREISKAKRKKGRT
jgi:hypothetical protein